MGKRLKELRNHNFYGMILPTVTKEIENKKLVLKRYSEYHFRIFNSKKDKFDFWSSSPMDVILGGIKRLKYLETAGENQDEEKLNPVKDEELLDKILYGKDGKRGV